MDKQLQSLYVDILLCSSRAVTATTASALTDNNISHDKFTRMLASKDFKSSDLWVATKKTYKEFEADGGLLIVDDSNSEKPYTDENSVISWNWSSKENRPVKGINFVTLLYSSNKGSVPIGFEVVVKDTEALNKKTGKMRPKASVSKHQHFRNLVWHALLNGVKFKHVLADIWFCSAENLIFIKYTCHQEAIMAVKGNRMVALSEEDKVAGMYVRIDSLDLGEGKTVWLKGVDFPLRLVRQIFKNEDDSTGVLYLVSTDLGLTDLQIQAIYQKRWKVETYHQSLNENCSLTKSPTKTPRTQIAHLFASLCAFTRLERATKLLQSTHFAFKQKIYIEGLKTTMRVLYDQYNTVNYKVDIPGGAPA
jgi:hypothetical protein